MFTLILLVVIVICLVYWVGFGAFNYWSARDVPFQKPTFFIGNMAKVFRTQLSLSGVYEELYRKFTDYKYFGFYKCRQPVIVVRDPDVAKQILVQDFAKFHDREMEVSKEADPLFGRNAFVLRGTEWKAVRSHLTPLFTAAKSKSVYPLIQANCVNVSTFMLAHEDQFKCVDARDFARKFALDNMYRCLYGIESDAFTNPDSEELRMQRAFLTQSFVQIVKEFCLLTVPSLGGLLSIDFIPKVARDHIEKITKETAKYRKTYNIERQDYLHTLIEKHKERDESRDIDLAADCAEFFVDGVESVSGVMNYAFYELASNLHVQTKLREEILALFVENGESVPYEKIGEMKYMEMVYKEFIRKNPSLPYYARICQEETMLPPPHEKSSRGVKVEVGTPVVVPVYAFHRDPAFFPNPEKFDPERFSPENIGNIPKGAYIPTGDGPRACMGQRLGQMQVKTMICTVLRNFEIRINSKTQEPLVLDPSSFVGVPIGGIWVDFHRIKK